MDYYDILGVNKGATEQEIKKAFRKKAAELHPDRNKSPNASQDFKRVNEAYQVLSDPQKRATYDRFGSAAFENGDGAGFGSGQGVQFDFSDFFGGGFDSVFEGNSPFEDLFGFGGNPRKKKRGSDLQINLEIELSDVLNGPEKEIQFSKKVSCDKCGGKGGSKTQKCRTCGGSGRVTQVTRSILGNIQVAKECQTCHGTGEEILDKCDKCNGSGTIDKVSTLKIRIPRGIEDGMTLRFTNEGNSIGSKGDNGDLFINITIKKHASIRRNQSNLVLDLIVPIYSVVLGEKYQVETLDGLKQIDIPAGFKVGQKILLKGLGLPQLNSSTRGDFIVNIIPDIPSKLSSEERKIFESLRDLGKSK